MGWTNPTLKPEGDAMSATQRAAMTFSYLRDDKAGFEKALWNCAEYQRDDTRQCMKRCGAVAATRGNPATKAESQPKHVLPEPVDGQTGRQSGRESGSRYG